LEWWGRLYALFYEYPDGHREWISGTETEAYAFILGRWWSQNSTMPVIAVNNLPSGETEVVCRFKGGERVEPAEKPPRTRRDH
jgi:hypothetical protein